MVSRSTGSSRPGIRRSSGVRSLDEAHYDCITCGERFILNRDSAAVDGIWKITVVHDHSGDTPTWTACLLSATVRYSRVPSQEAARRAEFQRQKAALREAKIEQSLGGSADREQQIEEYEKFME